MGQAAGLVVLSSESLRQTGDLLYAAAAPPTG